MVFQSRWHTVFSTCVEVILRLALQESHLSSILHVCGGDPSMLLSGCKNIEYSPRVWRWSSVGLCDSRITCVFSTCVEVIPMVTTALKQAISILHVCGGDPHQSPRSHYQFWYSPRVWRWSLSIVMWSKRLEVFSTCVEVIPITKHSEAVTPSILHVCGGDPVSTYLAFSWFKYSPRMWRWSCFHIPCIQLI